MSTFSKPGSALCCGMAREANGTREPNRTKVQVGKRMSKKRKKLTKAELNVKQLNASVCCVCKARGVGINFHHIDHNPSNRDPSNIAILCVGDHDAHHRPGEYPSRHTELRADKIREYKQEWEWFVAEAKRDHPQALAVINTYGNEDEIHSMKLIFQKVDGRIVLERSYHQLDGPVEACVDSMMEELKELAPNLKLILIDEPLPVEYCPCCEKSAFSSTLDWNVARKLTTPDWSTQSTGSVYINPQKASLAICIGYKGEEVVSASLHKCGEYLHFQTPKFGESVLIKRRPSVRTQAAKIIQEFIRDWSPGRIFVGTGDHEKPHLINDLLLPRVWEGPL